MKLLFATSLFPPDIGGPATYAKLVADRLREYGIDVEVLPFASVRRYPRFIRHVAYFFLVLVRARYADLVFVQDTVSTGLPVFLATKLAHKPFLLRVPGDYAWEQGRQRFGVTEDIESFQGRSYGIKIAALRAIQRTVAQTAAAVIVPSKYFARIVSSWGIRTDRVNVIYNSFGSMPAILPVRAPEPRTIVTVGRLVPWKGFLRLIDLMPRLPGWKLVILGEGPQRQALEIHARELGVADRVLLPGAVSREEVFAWYARAEAFVLNSSFESFSFQVAEALACGVPIIATAIGSIPELVEQSKEGLLVTPDDEDAILAAIASLEKEPEIWARRVEAGKKKAEQFTPPHMLSQLAALCNKISH